MDVLLTLHNESKIENNTIVYNKGLRNTVSYISTSINLAASLYIMTALLHHKYNSRAVSSTVTSKMNIFSLFNSCLVSVNATVNFLFVLLIETFHSDAFCMGFFSFQIGLVLSSRSFTYALFWIRQHHFYKKLGPTHRCLILFQKIFSSPLFVLGVFLPFFEFFLLYKHSSFYIYLNRAKCWSCGNNGFSAGAKSLTYLIYLLQTLFSVSLIVLVLIPIVVHERNKKNFTFSSRISRIGENIPRLSASIFVASLSDLVFIIVAVLVQRNDVDAIIDKTLLMSVILNANMIANLVCLQCSFIDYKRRLLFRKNVYGRSSSNFQLKSGKCSGRKGSRPALTISSIVTSFTADVSGSNERKKSMF